MPRKKVNPYQFSKFLNTADYLLQQTPLSEGSKRSAISRIYYGCFHIAAAYLQARRLLVQDSTSSRHTHVINSLEVGGLKHSAYLLRKLRGHRNAADYTAIIDNLDQRVIDSILSSKEFITSLHG